MDKNIDWNIFFKDSNFINLIDNQGSIRIISESIWNLKILV